MSITITLKLVGEGGEGGDGNISKQTDTGSFEGNSKDKKQKSAAWVLASQALAVAVNETLAWAEFYWDRELMLNDDYIGQRNKQIAMTQINRAIGYGGQIFSAAASGAAVGGGAGAIIGAIIGVASVTANIARSNVQGQLNQSVILAQGDAQLSFTRARAGWSTNAASIGEDL